MRCHSAFNHLSHRKTYTGNILKGISNRVRKDIFHINILKMSFLLVIDNNLLLMKKENDFF